MTIPQPWTLILLALAVYRLWRLIAVDDMPWLVHARNFAVGAHETAGVWTFRRATLAHALQCPWCSGLWVTAAWWGTWLAWPHGAVIVAVPFALATLVGALGHHLNE